MARYRIAGTIYQDEAEVMATYGAADYHLQDWREILEAGEPACHAGNQAAFPDLSGADIDELTAATMLYADAMVSASHGEGRA